MKICYKKIVLAILLVCGININAQNENNLWFFGNNSGVDFSTGLPVAVNSNLNTFEGCASISTNNGDLLFYTDGIRVYNKAGTIMTNGNGLLGNPSSTSSAIIVPKPCSEIEFYIFTVDYALGTNGVNYSLVNMDDDNDGIYEPATENGRIVTGVKNINLPGTTGERICAIKHNNGVDYWVTTTQANTNNFYTYLITSTGVSNVNIQPLGPIISLGYYMKFSSDGTKMARTNHATREIFIYDFDNLTGLLSNPQLIGNAPGRIYGVEFSADNQKVFYSDFANGNGTGTGGIYEVTISPSLGSPTQIASIPNQGGRYAVGALQQSPIDPNIIYAAMDGEFFLGEINVATSTFNRTALPLTNKCYLGLPTFVSGQVSHNCLNLDPYQNAVPDLFTSAIAAELVTGGSSKDKEYADFENDGDIDLFYTKLNAITNNIELYVIINNAGAGNPPNFVLPSVSLGIRFSQFTQSFRLYDWDNDGYNDVITHGFNGGIHLYINNQSGGYNTGQLMLNCGPDMPCATSNEFISVGDLNNDGFPDLIISGQDYINIYGTAYFENNQTNTYPFFNLVTPQVYTGGTIQNIFIDENNGSHPVPEIFDVDCDGDMDIFISDPLLGPPNYDGGRMYFHKNNGAVTTNVLPNINIIGQDNQYGFVDVAGNDLRCDWIITRIVDFYGTGCPIAITFNPCDNLFYYYDQDCSCGSLGSNTNAVIDSENDFAAKVTIYPNPANEYINVENNSNNIIKTVEIYNITGQLVIDTKFKNMPINISALKKGVYLIRIKSDAYTITKKLIIH